MSFLKMMVNRAASRVAGFGGGDATKFNHYCDFGWPEKITFAMYLRMYKRNSLAAAAVDMTIEKTWETMPILWEDEKPQETEEEKQIASHFDRARIWQGLMNSDRRGMVGAFGASILIIADGKALDQPVDSVSGGVYALRQAIPVWESELKVSAWDKDQTSETYGRPAMFTYREQEVGSEQSGTDIPVHPDRVLIWSEDGTISGSSVLEPGFNDLIDAEKVKGAGGAGFWKSSRGAPIITAPEGMSIDEIMKAFGAASSAEAIEKMNEQLDDFQRGFDKALMLGGLDAKPMTISLPLPQQFFDIPAMSFASSVKMPFRILLGNQTGERASTEDNREWNKRCMSRRQNYDLPILRELVARMVRWGMISDRPWYIGWADLTEATPSEKMERAAKMADINAKARGLDTPPFLEDEIREAAGFKTMAEVENQRGPNLEGE